MSAPSSRSTSRSLGGDSVQKAFSQIDEAKKMLSSFERKLSAASSSAAVSGLSHSSVTDRSVNRHQSSRDSADRLFGSDKETSGSVTPTNVNEQSLHYNEAPENNYETMNISNSILMTPTQTSQNQSMREFQFNALPAAGYSNQTKVTLSAGEYLAKQHKNIEQVKQRQRQRAAFNEILSSAEETGLDSDRHNEREPPPVATMNWSHHQPITNHKKYKAGQSETGDDQVTHKAGHKYTKAQLRAFMLARRQKASHAPDQPSVSSSHKRAVKYDQTAVQRYINAKRAELKHQHAVKDAQHQRHLKHEQYQLEQVLLQQAQRADISLLDLLVVDDLRRKYPHSDRDLVVPLAKERHLKRCDLQHGVLPEQSSSNQYKAQLANQQSAKLRHPRTEAKKLNDYKSSMNLSQKKTKSSQINTLKSSRTYLKHHKFPARPEVLNTVTGGVQAHSLDTVTGGVQAHSLDTVTGGVQAHSLDTVTGGVQAHSLDTVTGGVQAHSLDTVTGGVQAHSLDTVTGGVQAHSLDAVTGGVQAHSLDKVTGGVQAHSLDTVTGGVQAHSSDTVTGSVQAHSLATPVGLRETSSLRNMPFNATQNMDNHAPSLSSISNKSTSGRSDVSKGSIDQSAQSSNHDQPIRFIDNHPDQSASSNNRVQESDQMKVSVHQGSMASESQRIDRNELMKKNEVANRKTHKRQKMVMREAHQENTMDLVHDSDLNTQRSAISSIVPRDAMADLSTSMSQLDVVQQHLDNLHKLNSKLTQSINIQQYLDKEHKQTLVIDQNNRSTSSSSFVTNQSSSTSSADTVTERSLNRQTQQNASYHAQVLQTRAQQALQQLGSVQMCRENVTQVGHHMDMTQLNSLGFRPPPVEPDPDERDNHRYEVERRHASGQDWPLNLVKPSGVKRKETYSASAQPLVNTDNMNQSGATDQIIERVIERLTNEKHTKAKSADKTSGSRKMGGSGKGSVPLSAEPSNLSVSDVAQISSAVAAQTAQQVVLAHTRYTDQSAHASQNVSKSTSRVSSAGESKRRKQQAVHVHIGALKHYYMARMQHAIKRGTDNDDVSDVLSREFRHKRREILSTDLNEISLNDLMERTQTACSVLYQQIYELLSDIDTVDANIDATNMTPRFYLLQQQLLELKNLKLLHDGEHRSKRRAASANHPKEHIGRVSVSVQTTPRRTPPAPSLRREDEDNYYGKERQQTVVSQTSIEIVPAPVHSHAKSADDAIDLLSESDIFVPDHQAHEHLTNQRRLSWPAQPRQSETRTSHRNPMLGESISFGSTDSQEMVSRMQALRISLADKKQMAEKLKAEHRQRTSAHLKAQVQSLQRQSQIYDEDIARTQHQLSQLEQESMQGVDPSNLLAPSVPPKVCSPRNTGSHELLTTQVSDPVLSHSQSLERRASLEKLMVSPFAAVRQRTQSLKDDIRLFEEDGSYTETDYSTEDEVSSLASDPRPYSTPKYSMTVHAEQLYEDLIEEVIDQSVQSHSKLHMTERLFNVLLDEALTDTVQLREQQTIHVQEELIDEYDTSTFKRDRRRQQQQIVVPPIQLNEPMDLSTKDRDEDRSPRQLSVSRSELSAGQQSVLPQSKQYVELMVRFAYEHAADSSDPPENYYRQQLDESLNDSLLPLATARSDCALRSYQLMLWHMVRNYMTPKHPRTHKLPLQKVQERVAHELCLDAPKSNHVEATLNALPGAEHRASVVCRKQPVNRLELLLLAAVYEQEHVWVDFEYEERETMNKQVNGIFDTLLNESFTAVLNC